MSLNGLRTILQTIHRKSNEVHQLSSLKVFGVKFRAKFEVVLQKQFLSVVANHSKLDFSTAEIEGHMARKYGKEIRQVYSTEILSSTATIREVKLT